MLSNEDLVIRKHIFNSCVSSKLHRIRGGPFPGYAACLEKLDEMEKDGLVQRDGFQLTVTPKGRPFVRNVCMALDLELLRKAPTTKVFSMTV